MLARIRELLGGITSEQSRDYAPQMMLATAAPTGWTAPAGGFTPGYQPVPPPPPYAPPRPAVDAESLGGLPVPPAPEPVSEFPEVEDDPPEEPQNDLDYDDEDVEVEYTITPIGRLAEIVPQSFRYKAGAAHGTLLSMLLHVVALALIANSVIVMPEDLGSVELLTWVIEPEEELDMPEPELTLAPPDDEPHDNVLASMAASMNIEQSDRPELVREEDVRTMVDEVEVDLPQVPDLTGFIADEFVKVPGTVGQEVLHVDGAVDRITHEIAMRLETDPILVIWLMDSSISLVDERQQVAARLERVFEELTALDSSRDQRSMLNAVVAYGQGVRELVPPSNDGQLVTEAIRNVPTDESGIENVFSALIYAIDKYKRLITFEQRKCVVVIWTDESGDDYVRLDDAALACRRLAIPVFTVGPSAMFGREQGTHSYLHTDGVTYQLPVNRGPDAVHQERLRMPYWFEGDQMEVLHAGIGPFALTRLALESGGAYFINDAEEDRSPFSLETMREYLPDYVTANEYVQRVSNSPLRRAVLNAVLVTHKEKLKGTPRLLFEPTGRTYQQELLDAQKSAAFNTRILELAMNAFGRQGLEKEYEKEKSKRWRAWYDLTYGRLLAMYVRNNEYNWACATMKLKGTDFVDTQSNRWKFVASENISNSKAAKMADEATRLLTRCVEQNPGTPWAQMAQRELKDAFGFEVLEHYVAPPPPPPRVIRPTTPPKTPPPPPPPKMPPRRRTEQLKMIERPEPPKLPKL